MTRRVAPAEVEEFMLLPFAFEVVPDATTEGGTCYVAAHLELPGCMAHGETEQEALRNLDDARRLYIKTLLKRGLPVPRPKPITSAARVELIWMRAPAPTKTVGIRSVPVEVFA